MERSRRLEVARAINVDRSKKERRRKMSGIDLYDMSTTPPTLLSAVFRDIVSPSGKRYPRQIVDVWDDSKWGNEFGSIRPVVTVNAVPSAGMSISESHYVFNVNVIPHERNEVIDAEIPLIVFVPFYVIRERLESIGLWDTVATMVDALPASKKVKLFSLEFGVSQDDPDAIALLTAAGADPNTILAA